MTREEVIEKLEADIMFYSDRIPLDLNEAYLMNEYRFIFDAEQYEINPGYNRYSEFEDTRRGDYQTVFAIQKMVDEINMSDEGADPIEVLHEMIARKQEMIENGVPYISSKGAGYDLFSRVLNIWQEELDEIIDRGSWNEHE